MRKVKNKREVMKSSILYRVCPERSSQEQTSAKSTRRAMPIGQSQQLISNPAPVETPTDDPVAERFCVKPKYNDSNRSLGVYGQGRLQRHRLCKAYCTC
jgi:hypothetical protein